jgi:prepilin signal peptidase PulO-like enzyme (type II secretory pathway)
MQPDSFEFILSGIIMMLVIGPAVGNYATSVVFRLPFGQTPFEINPYCDSCKTMLQPKDLFPILSWLSTRGKCRYCSAPVPVCYTWVEVACGVVFVSNFLVFGISEAFIILTALATFLITLAALEHQQKKFYAQVWSWCLALAMLYRALHDGSIYPMIQSGFLLLFAAVILWRIARPGEKAVPAYVYMAALTGIVFPLNTVLPALAITAAVWILQRVMLGWRFATTAFAVGIWAGLLTGQL